MEIFFDTETTGLPQWKEDHTHPKQPDIIQLACILSTADEIVEQRCWILDPSVINPHWSMDDGAAATHGITLARIKEEGQCSSVVIPEFLGLLKQSTRAVAHNCDFDTKMVKVMLHRAGYNLGEALEGVRAYCTMKSTTKICNIAGPYGPKWPKLIELHRFLFNEDFDGAHDALEDVRATRRCYYELKRRGLIA